MSELFTLLVVLLLVGELVRSMFTVVIVDTRPPRQRRTTRGG